MYWGSRIKHVLIFFGLLAVVGFIAGILISSDFKPGDLSKPGYVFEMGTPGSKQTEVEASDPEEVQRNVAARTVYSICGHSEPLNLGNLRPMTASELRRTFPAAEGWSVSDSGVEIILAKKLDALCPECEKQTHLAAFGEYVAVVKGPVGVSGEVLEVTNIKIDGLPDHFRKQIRSRGLDFPDAQKLLEALDSLDEFSPEIDSEVEA